MFVLGLKAAAPSVQAGGDLAEAQAAPGFPAPILQYLMGPVLGVFSCHPCLVPGALSMRRGAKTCLFAAVCPALMDLVSWMLQDAIGKCSSVVPAPLD